MQGSSYDMSPQEDGRVLIVEDEVLSRRALALLLSSCGYQTTAAQSAEEALRLMRGESPPDIALVDVDLPGMSGLDFAKRLEETQPGIFTVLITAAEGDRIRNFLRDHPVAYLRKPVNFDHLLSVLSESQVH